MRQNVLGCLALVVSPQSLHACLAHTSRPFFATFSRAAVDGWIGPSGIRPAAHSSSRNWLSSSLGVWCSTAGRGEEVNHRLRLRELPALRGIDWSIAHRLVLSDEVGLGEPAINLPFHPSAPETSVWPRRSRPCSLLMSTKPMRRATCLLGRNVCQLPRRAARRLPRPAAFPLAQSFPS